MKTKLEVYQAFLKITKIFDKLGPEKCYQAFPELNEFIKLQVGNNLSLLDVMYADIYSKVEEDLKSENDLRQVNGLPPKSVDDIIEHLIVEKP